MAADIDNDYNDGSLCLKNYLRYAAAVSRGDTATARVLADLFDWRVERSLPGDADDAVVAQPSWHHRRRRRTRSRRSMALRTRKMPLYVLLEACAVAVTRLPRHRRK